MTVEVKTKLTLDDNASSSLKNIKQEFQGLHEESKQAQEGFTVMKQVVADFVKDGIHRGIEEIREFGHELIEAASHGQDVEQRLAGMTAAVQGVPWDEAKAGATGYFNDIQNIAVRTMQPIDDVEAGFNRLVEIQGATPDGLVRARQQIEQMAQVARVLGTSVETIGGQFAFMEEGTLKVKSQMFQLLQPTGIFEHQGMKAAQYWATLSEDQRGELLGKGLEKLSARMGQAVPTFRDNVNRLKNVWDQVEENFGTPIITALQPQIEKVSHWLSRSGDDVEKYANVMGDKVSVWVEDAADAVKDGFAFLQDHQAEIAADIKDAWAFAKEVMEFIVQHKEVLGLLAASRTELGKGVIDAARGSAGALMKAAPTAIGGAEITAFTGATIALGSLAAAVISVTIALKEWDDLMKITGGGKSDDQMGFEAIQKNLKEMVAAPDAQQWDAQGLERFDRLRANFIHLAEAAGESTAAAGFLADQAYAAHHAMESITGPLKAAADAFDSLAIQSGQLDSGGAVAMFASSFSQAAAAHNEGAMTYIGSLLSGDAALQAAFLNSADLTSDGFSQLAAHIGDASSGFRDKLMSLANGSSGKVKEMKPTINFGGGQTFKIQQDFRDQDPDKIAVIFRQDIFKAATQRIQAVGNTPFGT